MATLKQLETGEQILLGASHVVGRDHICQLRIDAACVSGLHARFDWTGSGWTVRDLGSRNGTFVDGHRLEPGVDRELRPGDEVALADGGVRFRLIDGSPPGLAGISEAGQVRFGDDEILCLPSEDEPEVMVYRGSDGRWLVEVGGGTPTPAANDAQLRAGGQVWRLKLPDTHAQTRDLGSGPILADCGFRFDVSRDGEHIEFSVECGSRRWTLEPRVHSELLLSLARVRDQDARTPDLPASEHGWIDREQLAQQIGVDPTLINLWTHRARRQLAAVGILDAEHCIERRASSTQLRLGVARLTIVDA
ncbi:MAG TPA: FHA domain-containing protein [Enhygromyxa sp.]|nr:FHA domain-containing protein [Enhygromyxa sp.]